MADDKSVKWIVISAAVGAVATLIIKDVVPAAFDLVWKRYSHSDHLTVTVIRRDNKKPVEKATVDLQSKEFSTLIDSKSTSEAGTAVFYDLAKDTYVISITFGAGISQTANTRPIPYDGGRKIEIIEMDFVTTGSQPPTPVTTNVANTPNALMKLLTVAQGELGQSELINNKPNPRVLDYLRSVNLPEDVATPWNSAFVNWVVKQAGLPGTNSGAARSWLFWGKSVAAPVVGSIAVFWRASPQSGLGSVGFVVRADETTITIISGNVENSVAETVLRKSQLIGIRTP
jgi:uncharacterized protein (TIGR02594 family)